MKRKERVSLRSIAAKRVPWTKLSEQERAKYIRFWRDRNKLEDNALMGEADDGTAQWCRVIFQNVYEPQVPVALHFTINQCSPLNFPSPPTLSPSLFASVPALKHGRMQVPEAVVPIDLLDPNINYEDVMDKVTEAMSADTFVVEVGEKTAMRRRLLNAWQFIRQIQKNITYQNMYRHLFQGLIILLTFISILTGDDDDVCCKNRDRLRLRHASHDVSCCRT